MLVNRRDKTVKEDICYTCANKNKCYSAFWHPTGLQMCAYRVPISERKNKITVDKNKTTVI